MKENAKIGLSILSFILTLISAIGIFIDISNSPPKLSFEYSSVLTVFEGKHYDDSSKRWLVNPNIILTADTPNAVGTLLRSMQILKVEVENKAHYALLCITKSNRKTIENSYQKLSSMPQLSYFLMDESQYRRLKLTIEQGRKNLSIISKRHGSFLLPTGNNISNEPMVEDAMRAVFNKPKDDSYDKYGVNPPFVNETEFIVTTGKVNNTATVRFLLPTRKGIKLEFFQNNYFEIPSSVFNNMLID